MIRRIARAIAGFSLVAGVLAVVPAAPASAGGSVVVNWQVSAVSAPRITYSCASATHTYESASVGQVTNNCGSRVWLHYDDYATGTIHSYCVNPGGGLAYAFSYPFTELQVTTSDSTTTKPCDYGAQFVIGWGYPTYYVNDGFACWPDDPQNPFTFATHWVYQLLDGGCNFRIWLHNTSTGATECLYGNTASLTYQVPYYWEVQETNNQVPCDDGGPPY